MILRLEIKADYIDDIEKTFWLGDSRFFFVSPITNYVCWNEEEIEGKTDKECWELLGVMKNLPMYDI